MVDATAEMRVTRSVARALAKTLGKPATVNSRGSCSEALKSNPGRRSSVERQPGCADGKRALQPQTSKLVLDLGRELVRATMVCRPSKRNRSPYVADVRLASSGREAIAHVPSLEMGGKCVPGATLLLKPARDKKGNLVGPDAVSPKYGTPKCEFIAQLLRVDETDTGGPCLWIGAHPKIGENIAEQLLERNLLAPAIPAQRELLREVAKIAGCDMRTDFVLTPVADGQHRHVIEVKTVVDTDYPADNVPKRTHAVFVSHAKPYRRAGIFPWGSARQKGPSNEPVVSGRAIKHVHELAAIARGDRVEQGVDGEQIPLAASVLFVVTRHDAEVFRPNLEACPSFAHQLVCAAADGVSVVAAKMRWGDGEDLGKCFYEGLLPVVLPAKADALDAYRRNVASASPKKAARRKRAPSSQQASAARRRQLA